VKRKLVVLLVSISMSLLLPGCTITKQISINIYQQADRGNAQHVVIDYKEKLF